MTTLSTGAAQCFRYTVHPVFGICPGLSGDLAILSTTRACPFLVNARMSVFPAFLLLFRTSYTLLFLPETVLPLSSVPLFQLSLLVATGPFRICRENLLYFRFVTVARSWCADGVSRAVANLSRYFVLAQVIGYVVQLTAPGLMSYMNFDMGSILHGQIWRVVTWIFTPTASLDVFGILFLFCVLMWGSSLESMLGTFRMNVFLWGSVILCDIVGAIVYVVTPIVLEEYGFSPYLSTRIIFSMSMLLGAGHVHAGGRRRTRPGIQIPFKITGGGILAGMCDSSKWGVSGCPGSGLAHLSAKQRKNYFVI